MFEEVYLSWKDSVKLVKFKLCLRFLYNLNYKIKFKMDVDI